MNRGIAAVVVVAGLWAEAHADCAVTGDPELVRSIEAVLAERGVDLTRCELSVQVERDREAIVIRIEDPSGPVERTVTELVTAATVIESFGVRDDHGAPLLPVRLHTQPLARAEPVLIVRLAVQESTPPRVQLFGLVETSTGSDHTNWMGGHVGVCITLGPLCAAARMRHASVVVGEGTEIERRSTEMLLGLDVPFRVGHTTLAPGFAAGLGSMWTRSRDGSTIAQTAGLRADVHATLSVPVTQTWAIDFSAALDLTQETHVESEMARSGIPDEPLALLRFGIGVRWGRR